MGLGELTVRLQYEGLMIGVQCQLLRLGVGGLSVRLQREGLMIGVQCQLVIDRGHVYMHAWATHPHTSTHLTNSNQ